MSFPVRPKHADRPQPAIVAVGPARPESENRATGPLLRFPGEGRAEEGARANARPSLSVTEGDRLVLSGMTGRASGRRGPWRSLVVAIFVALAAIGAASIVHAVAPVFSG